MARTITADELKQHNKNGDLWLAVGADVYDVSKFAKLHPGGAKVLEELGGRDVTSEFFELHRTDVLKKYTKLVIGRLDTASKEAERAKGISAVPFAEIPSFQGMNSPFYNDSHRRCLLAARKFVQEELVPIAMESDINGDYPEAELKQRLCTSGMMHTRIGKGPWLQAAKDLGISIPGDVAVEEYDYFHEMIIHMEIARLGLPGFIDSLGAGWMISVPAIFNFGSDEIRKTAGAACLKGEKTSCLAISEPFAGSDVSAIRTTAEKSPCGKFYIVNGIKKWITEGMYADYFVTAVRTGGDGAKGISMLLIERDDNVKTSQIKTTYSTAAGTALVIFDNCKVPVENLLGKENDGFRLVMYNFNHERFMIVCNLMGQARAALGDAFMWAKQRKVFGQPLINQAVIRQKLSASAAALESMQAYMEAICYDMCKAKDGPLGTRLAGPIAMLKFQASRAALKIADDTVQIMGGRGITRTGMGSKVEGFKNFVKFAAVYGGSEEIMADLAIKQALKRYPTGVEAMM